MYMECDNFNFINNYKTQAIKKIESNLSWFTKEKFPSLKSFSKRLVKANISDQKEDNLALQTIPKQQDFI